MNEDFTQLATDFQVAHIAAVEAPGPAASPVEAIASRAEAPSPTAGPASSQSVYYDDREVYGC